MLASLQTIRGGDHELPGRRGAPVAIFLCAERYAAMGVESPGPFLAVCGTIAVTVAIHKVRLPRPRFSYRSYPTHLRAQPTAI